MSDNKLNVIDLHKRYGEHEVLKGVSLRAKAGDVISIIGSSGSGKSTFLRCINFLEKPSEGTIVVNGQNIGLCRAWPAAARASRRWPVRSPTSSNIIISLKHSSGSFTRK